MFTWKLFLLFLWVSDVFLLMNPRLIAFLILSVLQISWTEAHASIICPPSFFLESILFFEVWFNFLFPYLLGLNNQNQRQRDCSTHRLVSICTECAA